MKCYHCGEQHWVGDRKCQEQVKQEEILAIQLKSRVSKERNKELDKRGIDSEKSRRKMEDDKKDKAEKQRHSETTARDQETEIVCIKPNTGELFTTTIQIDNTMETVESELEGTSECNPGLREEAKKIYEEMSTSDAMKKEGTKRRSRSRSRRNSKENRKKQRHRSHSEPKRRRSHR